MGYKFNPLIFMGLDLSGSGAAGDVHWQSPVANQASLPLTGNDPGDIRVTLDTGNIWEWDGTMWFLPAIPYNEKGAPNGVAPLDGGGKVPYANLPNAIMTYKGTWNPTTNTPTLVNGTGQAGDVYRASVDGASTAPMVENWFAGDFIIYDGTIWQRSPLADGVVSVNGFNGVVLLSTTDIPEGTNLYFTDVRAQTAAVENAINSGTINKAPSEDAVYNALALKADTNLGNLTSPTAVNQTLNLGTNDILDIGKIVIGGSTPAVSNPSLTTIGANAAMFATGLTASDSAIHIFPSTVVPSYFQGFNGDITANKDIGLQLSGGNVLIGGVPTRLVTDLLDVGGSVKVAGKIHNVTDPTAAQDAATKNYVDTAVSTAPYANQTLSNLTNPTAVNQDLNMGNTNSVLNASRMSIGTTTQVGKLQVDNLISEALIPAISMRIADSPTFGFDMYQEFGGGGDFSLQAVDSGVSTEALRILRATAAVSIPNALTVGGLAGLTTLDVSGTSSLHNTLNMNSHRINNVTNPAAAQDAATKSYVDTGDALAANKTLSNLTNPTAVNQDLNMGNATSLLNANRISVGTTTQVGKLQVDNLTTEAAIPAISMRIADALNYGFDIIHDTSNTGDMYINRVDNGTSSEAFRIARADGLITVQNRIANVTDPANPQDAATKNYVDSQVSTKMSTNFSNAIASTVALDLGSHQIHNVTNPTSAQDAATKNYVDTAVAGGGATNVIGTPGADVLIDAVPTSSFASLLSTVTSVTTGGQENTYSLATAVFSGKRYAYIPIVVGSTVIIQVINLTDNTIDQEFTTAISSQFFGGVGASNFSNMLYLDDANSHAKAAFNIDPTNGQITTQASPSLTWSGSEGGMAITADGKFLIFAGSAGTQSHSIASNGDTTSVNSQSGQNFGSTPFVSPTGKWVVAGTTGVTAQIMSLDPVTGILGSPTNVPNCEKVAFSPDGKFFYSNTGHAFSLNDTTGAVVDLGLQFTAVNLLNNHNGNPIAVTPNGSTVITMDGTGVVASYSRNPVTGTVTLINATLLSTGNAGIANITTTIGCTNTAILVPAGYVNNASPPTKIYTFAAPAQGVINLATPTKLSSAMSVNTRIVTTTDIATSDDNVIIFTTAAGSETFTLPPGTDGRLIQVTTDTLFAGTFTLTPNGTDTLSAGVSPAITAGVKFILVFKSGVWYNLSS